VIRRLQADAILEAVDHRMVAGGRELPELVPLAVPHDSADTAAYRAGYAEGFEAGEGDGLREATERMRTLEDEVQLRARELTAERERLAALTDGMAEALLRHAASMEQLAFEVALTSLARAFGELPEDRQLLQRLCAQMVEEFRVKAVRICVSTADRPTLPELIEGLEVTAEGELARGECRIVTERGQAESSIAMRLGAIFDTMLEALGAHRS
jgi:flagellar biosynthesis/type III secretory pathway protein FliH